MSRKLPPCSEYSPQLQLVEFTTIFVDSCKGRNPGVSFYILYCCDFVASRYRHLAHVEHFVIIRETTRCVRTHLPSGVTSIYRSVNYPSLVQFRDFFPETFVPGVSRTIFGTSIRYFHLAHLGIVQKAQLS